MAGSGFSRPQGPRLLALAAALLLHAALLCQAWHPAGSVPAGQARRGLTVALLQPPPATAAQPAAPAPAPGPETSLTPAPSVPAAPAAAHDAAAWLLPEQLQAASIELNYPDTLLPGGQLTLRWWLSLNPDGSVAALESNANASSPESFVSAAVQALQAARFSAAMLGLPALPAQLCLELRYQETAAPDEHVQLRRLDVKLNGKGGAAPCVGTAPPGVPPER
ncbi:MAG: hypothetical protein GXC94_11265 [Comamonadaceae bacterium]|nr:hypothetical protein [Comamonadaceae bacterium]